MTDHENRFIFGAAVGSGLTALAVDKAGADFILVLNAGRLRMRGATSLASYLPLRDANEWVFEIAQEEILHRCTSPVLAGLTVRDPLVDPAELVERAKRLGFAGVCNFPSSALLDGQLRRLTDSEGIGFGKECALIREATSLGMSSLAYVTTNREARMMHEAGADMICVAVGFTSGGTGVATNLTLEAAADLANVVLEGIPANVKTLIEGGPITSPEDALTVTRLCRVNGYVAGSTIDRLPLEQTIGEVARSFKVISKIPERVAVDAFQGSVLIGNSHAMQNLRKMLSEVAPSKLSVLISGETGTGKSMIARDLHAQSGITKRSPVVVDCLGINADVGPVQLMGQVAGMNRKGVPITRGALEMAHGNSLVFEDVAELSPELQGLILRFAETGHVQRIGELEGRKSDVRLISVSGPDISDLVERQVFRRDLFFRLNEFQLSVPALRHRRDDIPGLAKHFASGHSDGEEISFTNSALRILIEHDWPGNVRELRNAIRRVLTLNQSGRVTARDVEFLTRAASIAPAPIAATQLPDDPGSERDWIASALKRHKYRKAETARFLGLSLRTLYNKIQRFQLE